MDMEWMAWTKPTAVFFALIGLLLCVMTILELLFPTVKRRGLLLFGTTRGDRLFLSLLSAAFIHIGFVAFSDVQTLWVPLTLSVVWAVLLMRFG